MIFSRSAFQSLRAFIRPMQMESDAAQNRGFGSSGFDRKIASCTCEISTFGVLGSAFNQSGCAY